MQKYINFKLNIDNDINNILTLLKIRKQVR